MLRNQHTVKKSYYFEGKGLHTGTYSHMKLTPAPCIKLFVRKDGEFTSMHIHDSQAMKDRGIHCVLDQDKEARESGKAY